MSIQMPFLCRSYAVLMAALLLPALGLAQTETKLNNFGSSPVFLLTTPYTNGQCLVYSTSSLAWINSSCGGGGSGTVTSVGLSVPGSSLFGVSGSPVTTSGTLGLTTTGTSGGIPYFSSSSTLASSSALTANALVLGGGAGGTPTVLGSLGTTTTVLHGNATGAPAFSAIVAGDLPAGVPTAAANPTGSVGLSAVNGSATTFTRSDAAPALSLGINPIGANSFTATWEWSLAEPRLLLNQSGAGTDLKLWDFDLASGVLSGRTRTDADAAGKSWLAVTRGTTTAISTITFGNASDAISYNFTNNGTGNANFSGPIVAPRVVVTQTTVATNGIYLPAASTLGFGAGGTGVGSWTTTAFSAFNGVLIPGIASSTAAQTGTLCWSTGTGNVTEDPSSTCLVSARRFKDHIEPLDTGLEEVLRLQPVRYHLKADVAASIDDPSNYAYGEQVGFIAEDVAEVDQRLVSYESDGQAHSVRYLQMTALLAHAIQQEHAVVALQLKRQQQQIYGLGLTCLALIGWCSILSRAQWRRRR